MRRLWMLVLLAGCSRPHEPPKTEWAIPDHDGGELSPKIEIGDPSSTWQRLEGIYQVQDNSWAWTAPKFSVLLAPRRPRLVVKLFLAGPQMDQLKELTLRARIKGVELAPETYRKPGPQVYIRDLDPKLLDGPVRVDFSVDDVFHPKPPDTRKLGIVVNSLAIEEQ
jgi:hypothetical protein